MQCYNTAEVWQQVLRVCSVSESDSVRHVAMQSAATKRQLQRLTEQHALQLQQQRAQTQQQVDGLRAELDTAQKQLQEAQQQLAAQQAEHSQQLQEPTASVATLQHQQQQQQQW